MIYRLAVATTRHATGSLIDQFQVQIRNAAPSELEFLLTPDGPLLSEGNSQPGQEGKRSSNLLRRLELFNQLVRGGAGQAGGPSRIPPELQ